MPNSGKLFLLNHLPLMASSTTLNVVTMPASTLSFPYIDRERHALLFEDLKEAFKPYFFPLTKICQIWQAQYMTIYMLSKNC